MVRVSDANDVYDSTVTANGHLTKLKFVASAVSEILRGSQNFTNMSRSYRKVF